MTARPEALRAAKTVVTDYGIRGIVDPDYIANVIEAELLRFEQEPDAELIPWHFRGTDVASGLTMDQLISAANAAAVSQAARASAIDVVRSYGSSVGNDTKERYAAVTNIARSIERDLVTISPPARAASALARINRHRRAIGQAPLDPAGSGWTEEDVLIEERRLEERGLVNPVDEIKRRMLAW